MAGSLIEVSVCCAEPLRAIERSYRVSPAACVDDVLQLAAADAAFKGIAFAGRTVGIFGHVVDARQPLNHGDRIELYRPLLVDPKSARRTRAREAARRPGIARRRS